MGPAFPTRQRRRKLLSAAIASTALVATTPALAPAATAAQTARAAAAEAYLYGLPLLSVLDTIKQLPVNVAVSSGNLVTASQRLVVLPNQDTLYTLAHLDVHAQPQILHVPDTGGRYYTMELLDAYTNVIANVGRRATGTGAGDFAIVGPGWRGTPPPGVHEIRSPTPDVWIIGRTLVQNAADIPAARALQAQYTVFGLSTLGTPAQPASSIVLTSPPTFRPGIPPLGLPFLDELGRALVADPPPPRDAALIRRLRAGGLGPGTAPSQTSNPSLQAAWSAGLRDGRRRLTSYVAQLRRRSRRSHRGWLLLGAGVGRYGTHYEQRAAVTMQGLGANVPQESLYPIATTDAAGRPLTGAHRYVVTFAAGRLPPVDAFWSLTLYAADLYFYANPLNRYALGDRSGLHRAADGSLSIAISHAPPAGDQINWLPAPGGKFELALRLYQPRASALDGRWPLPLIRRVG